jgi:hypothetical protein
MDDGCTSIEDQRDCQSNQRYLAASLFNDNKKGISVKPVFKDKNIDNNPE